MAGSAFQVTLVTPTYNEKENLPLLAEEIFQKLSSCPDIDLEWDAYRRDDLTFFYWTEEPDIEHRFLDHFATALKPSHPDTRCRKYSAEEISTAFATKSKEAALDYFTSQVPLEVQRDSPGDHMNWFNTSKIIRMLREADFENVWESRYGQSRSVPLRNTRLFDSTHPEFSLYVECQK